MLTTNSSLMDGINRHILNICPALNRMYDIEVAVCTVFPHGDLNTELEKQGVRTFSLNAHNGHELKIIPAYIKVMWVFAPDIVHVHVMALMERIVSALCFRRVKYVCTVHGIADKMARMTMRVRIEKLLDRVFGVSYSVVCYISNGVKEALHSKDCKVSCDVVYNPIDFDYLSKSSVSLHNEIGVPEGTLIVGTACRVAKVKQPKLFTEVMCKVLLNIKEAHAVVIGDGDRGLLNACKGIVAMYGVCDRFHWLGYRKDAPQLVTGLSCFVMTSISEGLPTSLLECMASKIPFAFLEGKGGLKDIAELNKQFGSFAIIASSDNINKFVLDICNLIKTPSNKLCYTEAAYKVGKKVFGIDSVTRKLKSIYVQIE